MLAIKPSLLVCLSLVLTSACAEQSSTKKEKVMAETEIRNLEIATLGAGCFWCVEAVFELLDGVHSVESGYMGGSVKNPTYREVCAGTTGHAEVTQIHFDPQVISFETLLDWLWRSHDPTTLNRQGYDEGNNTVLQSFTIAKHTRTLLKPPKPPLRHSSKIRL